MSITTIPVVSTEPQSMSLDMYSEKKFWFLHLKVYSQTEIRHYKSVILIRNQEFLYQFKVNF